MIGVIVGDDESRYGFAKMPSVGDDFARMWQSVLSVDHKKLRGKLDDMRIDEPTVFGAVKVWIGATSLRVTVQPSGTGNLLDLLRWTP
jgi:hypothetical protein